MIAPKNWAITVLVLAVAAAALPATAAGVRARSAAVRQQGMIRSMKRLWKRSTTAVEIAQLPAAVLAAVRRHAETVGADDPSTNVTHACVTTSESLERKRRLRRPTPPVDVYMLLAEPLLVVVADQEGRMVASFLRLDEIELTEFKSPLVDDVGLEVFGTAVGATERAMRFLPLDHGSAGAAFRTALLDRVR